MHAFYQSKNNRRALLALVLFSCLLAAAFQAVTAAGPFWQGFLAAAILIFICGGALLIVWTWVGREKQLGAMLLIAFLARLFLGSLLTWALPQFGYDTAPQKAGFVFEDAYRREENAWALANADEPLVRAFSDDYGTDQYGGMLALSALVYRSLSPDAFRPGLIIILAAGAMALSIPFFITTFRRLINHRSALIAGWIVALYPEGVLLGSAQMREPFYIFLLAVLLWAAVRWTIPARRLLAGTLFVISAFILFLFSYRVALPLVGVVLLLMWAMALRKMKSRSWKLAGWVGVAVLAVVAVVLFRSWFIEVRNWDLRQTVLGSGMLQFQLERLPEWLHFPFVLFYGMLQPVLPAAIAAPAPWVWKGLGIFRAVGWYALLPLLIYTLIRVWRASPELARRVLLVLAAVGWIWIIIASARAGGDQWDNPRYRTIFLPFYALLAGWGMDFALQTKDRWFVRIAAIEAVFLLVFTEWYLSRYFPVIPGPSFQVMIVIILVGSLGIVSGGLWLDRRSRKSNLTD